MLSPASTAVTPPTASQRPSGSVVVGSPLQPNAGAAGLPLTATNSGAIPASIGGTAVLGATGRDMAECMAAWDGQTHISRPRWREICKSTLAEADM